MPPKRASQTSGGPSKRSKPSPPDVPIAAGPPAPPRDPRWSPLSGSANVDMGFKKFLQKPEAYEYILMCRMPGCDDDSDEEEEEEEVEEEEEDEEGEDDDKEKNKKPRCDAGKTCVCNKPTSEHPEHKWKITDAGRQRFYGAMTMADLRDPDFFSMYTFNDHAAYGVFEVYQNILLDFKQAAGDYKLQWVICEGLALFMSTNTGGMLCMIDDGEGANATFSMVARLFLTMLATLERKKLISADSEIQNLGLIMGLFLVALHDLKEYNMVEDSKSEPIGPKKDKKVWAPHEFPSHVLAYARAYDIKLVGPAKLDEIIADLNEDADLPVPASNTDKADVFGFDKTFKSYTAKYGGICDFLSKRALTGKSGIGGDALDMTTWTSAERKQWAYTKKDPLGKRELDALKRGDIMMRG